MDSEIEFPRAEVRRLRDHEGGRRVVIPAWTRNHPDGPERGQAVMPHEFSGKGRGGRGPEPALAELEQKSGRTGWR
jgi:hypothetical protein